MNKLGLSALALVAMAGAANAAPPPVAPSAAVIQGMQLEMQLVARTYGTNTTPPASSPAVMTDISPALYPLGIPAGTLIRFEIRYKITDLLPGDAYVPGGLQGASINVRTNVPIGTQSGPFTSGNFQTSGAIGGLYSNGANPGFRAALASVAQATAPAGGNGAPIGPGLSNPDITGASATRGLFEPLRGGFTTGTSPNGGFFGNGVLPGDQTDPFVTSFNTTGNLGIFNILPVNVGTFPAGSGVVYGIYAFDFLTTIAQPATWTFSFDTISPVIGIRGNYINDNDDPDFEPYLGATVTNAVNGGSASLTFAVPAPGTAALLGLGGLVAARRRRTA